MPRDDGKKYKATYGVCVECEEIFKHGDYGYKDGFIFCKPCMAKYEVDPDPAKNRKYQ